jgi:ferritin
MKKQKEMFKANFNIRKELWEEFKKVVKENDTNASYTIVNFIKEYIDEKKN